VRAQDLEAGAHERCDPGAHAQTEQLRPVDPAQHLAIRPVLEMDQEVIAAPWEQAPGEAHVHPEVGRAGA
jgi:hypothetical protein